MKNIIKVGALSLLLCGGLTACDSFFDSVPGVQYDLEGTFSNRQKTEQFLNNVYSYVPDETQERWPTSARGGIWTGGSLESNITWSWHITIPERSYMFSMHPLMSAYVSQLSFPLFMSSHSARYIFIAML